MTVRVEFEYRGRGCTCGGGWNYEMGQVPAKGERITVHGHLLAPAGGRIELLVLRVNHHVNTSVTLHQGKFPDAILRCKVVRIIGASECG